MPCFGPSLSPATASFIPSRYGQGSFPHLGPFPLVPSLSLPSSLLLIPSAPSFGSSVSPFLHSFLPSLSLLPPSLVSSLCHPSHHALGPSPQSFPLSVFHQPLVLDLPSVPLHPLPCLTKSIPLAFPSVSSVMAFSILSLALLPPSLIFSSPFHSPYLSASLHSSSSSLSACPFRAEVPLVPLMGWFQAPS